LTETFDVDLLDRLINSHLLERDDQYTSHTDTNNDASMCRFL